MFALVDCNSFYASCEKVFQPHLEGKPLIVLSSNDGCAIARSSEAKALGIKMGDPFFQIKDVVQKNHVVVFSSNFSLYGNLSWRVMETLRRFSSSLEIYSIDEAFLRLKFDPKEDLFSYGCLIRETVKRWTGIPVSVGIGSTKTLAKVANHLAKTHPQGCCVLVTSKEIENALQLLPLQDVWGIGRQWSRKLSLFGFKTALDLAQADLRFIKDTFNVVLAHTVMELKGISCLSIEDEELPKKSMVSSRSFGNPVTSLESLREAISFHASRLGYKLRKQKSMTTVLKVFVRAKPFHSNFYIVPLRYPTQDTAVLIKAALWGLEKIFRKGFSYKKAGVMVLHLVPTDTIVPSLFQTKGEIQKRKYLLKAVDGLNRRFGKGALIFASEGVHKLWRAKSFLKSPNFTGDWAQLPQVN